MTEYTASISHSLDGGLGAFTVPDGTQYQTTHYDTCDMLQAIAQGEIPHSARLDTGWAGGVYLIVEFTPPDDFVFPR
jgi:hypothetical protein